MNLLSRNCAENKLTVEKAAVRLSKPVHRIWWIVSDLLLTENLILFDFSSLSLERRQQLRQPTCYESVWRRAEQQPLS